MHRFSSSSRTASLSLSAVPLPAPPVLDPLPVIIDDEEDDEDEDDEEDEEILPMNPKQAFKNPSCPSSWPLSGPSVTAPYGS